MVCGHVVTDCSDHLVVAITTGDEPAFAPNQLRHEFSSPRPAGQCTAKLSGVASTLTHPLRIQICGSLAIEHEGERWEARLPGRQGRLLFTYLVLNRHRQIPREELADALWNEPDPPAIDSRLNPLLSKLRRVIGVDALDGRSTIQLHLPGAWIDLEAAVEAIHRAESAVAQEDWKRAWGPVLVALFVSERDFLPGEDAAWIDETRNQLTLLRLRALECYAAAELGMAGSELGGAVRAGQQLIRLAPLRESGYRYLMRALAAQDNLAEAVHVYGRLSDCLRDELGVSPSLATRQLYEQLLAAT